MPSAARSSRSCVAVDGSAAVYVCDGHGRRQPWPPSGLQASGIAEEGGGLLSPPHAATTRTTRIVRWVIRRLDGNIGILHRRPQTCPSAAMAVNIGARVYLPFLDRLLYRRPFEGGSARRYADDERPAFGDLDDRLLDRLAPELTAPTGEPGRRLLDLGCGPATFARRA